MDTLKQIQNRDLLVSRSDDGVAIVPLRREKENTFLEPSPIIVANALANPSKYKLAYYPNSMWPIRVKRVTLRAKM